MCRYTLYIQLYALRCVIMTITAINGIYDYGATYQRQFFVSTISPQKLNELMDEYGIKRTGNAYSDMKELYKAMYGDYSQQATAAAAYQAGQQPEMRYPWEGVMAKIGLAATGDYEKDKAAFESALRQLTQIAQGDQQAYLAQLQHEGRAAFSSGAPDAPPVQTVSGYDIMAQVNRAFINY